MNGSRCSVCGHRWSLALPGSSATWDPPSKGICLPRPCMGCLPHTLQLSSSDLPFPHWETGTPTGPCSPHRHLVKGTGPPTKQSLYEPHKEAASAVENGLINGRLQHEGLGAGEWVLSPGSGKRDPGSAWLCARPRGGAASEPTCRPAAGISCKRLCKPSEGHSPGATRKGNVGNASEV